MNRRDCLLGIGRTSPLFGGIGGRGCAILDTLTIILKIGGVDERRMGVVEKLSMRSGSEGGISLL